MGDGARWRTLDMIRDESGRFRLRLDSVTTSFNNRVLAGGVTSPTYSVTVANPPRVTRVDLDYRYPAASGLAPRRDPDGGDIYAPAGTTVQVRVRADRPVAAALIVLADGQRIPLDAVAPQVASGEVSVTADGSYRIVLVGADGVVNNSGTEYFIRQLTNRPPAVRIVSPGSDRSVTAHEEVDIEARADDDLGLDWIELVYAVRGGHEEVVPLPMPAQATTVQVLHTLRMEQLAVQPGDFVSYYVRARDRRPDRSGSEARSDLFFIEVTDARSAAGPSSAGGISPVDDLVAAQREITAATWKVTRRMEAVAGARPVRDIRSLAKGEADFRLRVEQTSGAETARAAAAMGRAVSSLDRLDTAGALPAEMDALAHLLKGTVRPQAQ